MKLLAVLWHINGYKEPGELVRVFYKDGTLVQVFENRVQVKQCSVEVINDIVIAHLGAGWSQFPT